ncbi:hypothetical protein [Actinomadura rifamycini]|uniref:hypothetical protein n=1 Tax=Actinomadura rifamycini TaxID=31962 RepID=UPI0004105FF2|nr:hypothetical protein [Actinomadura rifamycini]
MGLRTRTTALTGCAAAALVLTGCGGGGEGGHGGTGAAASAPPTAVAPLPRVSPAAVEPLVGRWVGKTKDYFQFAADGRGVWKKGRHELWSGSVIHEGGRAFRFSWNGGDPETESNWGVTLSEKGDELTFGGTKQTYTKVKG